MFDNRISVRELDFSGFVLPRNFQFGGMVIDADMGDEFPVLIESDSLYSALYGQPSSTKFGGFEALTYISEAPLWVSAPFGANARWAGVDVFANEVKSFGTRTGRNFRAFVDYQNIQTDETTQNPTAGNGVQTTFTGNINVPVVPNTVKFVLGGKVIGTDDGAGNIVGAPLVTSGTINYSTGAYTVTFAGAAGTQATYTNKIDLSSNVNLSIIASAGFAEIDFISPINGSTIAGIITGTYYLALDIDGGGVAEYELIIESTDTWATIVGKINTALNGDAVAGIIGNRLRITSPTSGSSSSIVIDTAVADDFIAGIDATGNLTSKLTPVVGRNAGVKIEIDNITIDNIDVGASAATTRASIISAINTAFNAVNPAYNTVAATSGTEYFSLTGVRRNPNVGKIRISAPSVLPSALNAVFEAGELISEDVAATHSTGGIPKDGQFLFVESVYMVNLDTAISHSFFTRSPYNDSTQTLSVKITHLGGVSFRLELFKKVGVGQYLPLETYTYSLEKGTDGFGKSLYIFDVFRNSSYLVPFVNSNFSGTYGTYPTSAIDLTGGYRGDVLTSTEFYNAWQEFKYSAKTPVKTFVDVYGHSATTVVNLIEDYQPYAFGVTTVPRGYTADEAVAFRQTLGIDNRKMAIYTNWMEIRDPFNDSTAWVSGVGKITVKYAQMSPVFDGYSPAGVSASGYNGQVSGIGYEVIRMEREYTPTEMDKLRFAQINPFVRTENYGIVAMGDNTMQVRSSDTSFIHTSRNVNYILRRVTTEVLPLQLFAFNNGANRNTMEQLVRQITDPVVDAGVATEIAVFSNLQNNTDTVRDQRRFAVDIYYKATPNSQEIEMKLIRLNQSQSIVQFG